MTPNLVLWIYVALLVAGGLIGFLKAGSKISLIMSLAFGIPIALEAWGKLSVPHLADILIAVLLVFFGMKFVKGKKFMPAGLMTIASIAALVLRLLVLK
ncbi:MAG: TMEM14 family protein [Verrucomicrobia bacterium]|nr:TMEM14 family protein [Verrucomicrobiota bacterium]